MLSWARFGIVFHLALDAQMDSGGGGIVLMGPLGPPGRSRGCLGPLRWLSWGSGSGFGYSEASLGVVLVCSWGRFGASGGFLRCFNRRFVVVSSCLWFRCVRCCFVLVFVVSCSLTYLLIYSSTHQPMALRHFLTRPGGLRAARLNPPPPEGSERVWTVFKKFFEFFEFKRV